MCVSTWRQSCEAGGMSRLPQCRPVAVHIPVTRQRSGQCTGAPRRVPGATARRVYHEVQYTRVHQSVTNANGNIKVLASVKYLRLSKSADVGRLSTKPAGALHVPRSDLLLNKLHTCTDASKYKVFGSEYTSNLWLIFKIEAEIQPCGLSDCVHCDYQRLYNAVPNGSHSQGHTRKHAPFHRF